MRDPSLLRRRVPYPWLPTVVLLAGLVATAAYTAQIWRAARIEDQQQFNAAVDRRVQAITAEIEKYTALLRGGAGLFASAHEVTREGFRRYVDRLAVDERYPGIQGIGYCQRLEAGETEAFIERQRASGIPSYVIWPADRRPEYYPIVYLEPLDRRNRAALGYDMFTERVRHEAMARARDTAAPAVTKRVTLVQEIDENKQPGFLVYVAVYEGGAVPPSVEERRSLLRGFVYSPFRVGDFLRHVMAEWGWPALHFELFHSAEPTDQNKMFEWGTHETRPRFTAVRRMDVAGSAWSAKFYAPSAPGVSAGRFPWVILAGGTSLSLLLAGLVRAQARTRLTEERATRATRELSEAEGRHARRLAGILESITDAFLALDGEWRFTYVNARAIEYLQRPREALLGRVIWDVLPEMLGTTFELQCRRAVSDRQSCSFDYLSASSGRWLQVQVYPSSDGVSVSFRDISDAKARDEQIQLHARVLENMTEGVSLSDESGVIVWTNPAEDRMFGYEPGELLGRHVTEQNAYPPAENERVVREVMDTVRRTGEWRGQWHNRRKDGSTFITEATITAVPRSEQLLWVCVQRDITERVAAEQRFRMMADSAPVLVWMADEGKACVWFNKPWLDYTGRTMEQELGYGWVDGVHPDDYERCVRTYSDAFDARAPFAMEYRLRRHDGEYRWMHDTGRPLFESEGGEFSGFIGGCVDVHESKRAAEVLAESEARFRQLADSIPQLAWMARPDGALFWFNRRWYEYTGSTLEEMQGWGWQRLHDPRELPRVLTKFRTCIATGDAWEDTFPLRRRDGEYRWHLSRALPLRGADGRIVLWFGTNTDVTEQRQIAEERQQLLDAERAARAEAERVGRMKDEFLATLSHELRTPLSAILGWAQILAHRADLNRDDARRGVETIHRNARAQAQIIDDLLDMHRIVSGKVRLDLQPVDVTEIAEAALDVVRPMADSKGVRLQARIGRDLGVAHADPARLQQVLWNLLTNAIKFTPAGGSVSLELSRADDGIELKVIDTGQGLPPGFLPHVFERFRQADATFSRKHAGLGLGLSIVKSLVELHGGTVTAESGGEGMGAFFTVVLPQHAHDATQPPRYAPAVAASVANDPEEPVALLPGVSVLVVEDDEATRELLTILLTRSGAAVEAAPSARRALELMADRPRAFDVLVSDIGMPEMDGYEFIRLVRALPPELGGRVPAMALTAFARAEDGAKAMAAGYQVHVRKPFDPSEVVLTIARLTRVAAAGATDTGDERAVM
jgi:PAS domain S-box-containing protein